jgi:hypothetical protein
VPGGLFYFLQTSVASGARIHFKAEARRGNELSPFGRGLTVPVVPDREVILFTDDNQSQRSVEANVFLKSLDAGKPSVKRR